MAFNAFSVPVHLLLVTFSFTFVISSPFSPSFLYCFNNLLVFVFFRQFLFLESTLPRAKYANKYALTSNLQGLPISPRAMIVAIKPATMAMTEANKNKR